MRRLNRLSLRLRLTLVFAGASLLLLAGIGTFLYLEVKSGLGMSRPVLRSESGRSSTGNGSSGTLPT